ncbi:hypothetical protein, partial [Streptomyces salyersiae]
MHEELGELPARAARHLPPRLLGWWPSEEYARAKARRRAPGPLATVTPLAPRASARTGTRSGATPAARHRRARCGRWCALVLRTVRRMAWRAVVLVLVAGAVVGGLLAEHTTDRWSAGGGGATAPAQDPRAPLRADRPIAAEPELQACRAPGDPGDLGDQPVQVPPAEAHPLVDERGAVGEPSGAGGVGGELQGPLRGGEP